MIITGSLRILQILFCVVSLGLSISLIKGTWVGSVAPQTGYASFCGGIGLLIATVGILALFVESLHGKITAGLDAFAFLFLAAGGIANAVNLGIHSCTNMEFDWQNKIIQGGPERRYHKTDADNALVSRCRVAQAETAFLFFACTLFAITSVVGFMTRGRGKSSIV